MVTKKVPLRRLFRSVKFESRNILLAISTENLDFVIKDAERIFTDTFSEKTDVLEEKNQNNIHGISVNIPVNCVSPAKVGCFIQFVIKICYKKYYFCIVFVIYNLFQEGGRVSLVLPGSLMKFDKEIKEIIRIEKARFLANQRFSRVFSDIELGHVFANNANLKKLIVRTRIS